MTEHEATSTTGNAIAISKQEPPRFGGVGPFVIPQH
jgi:hypothetical protein